MPDQQKYTTKLANDHVLIIGGSSGIGYCIAEACLEQGASVTIASSRKMRVESALSQLRQSYPSAVSRVAGHVCDLSNASTLESSVVDLFANIPAPIHHIVYTAGDPISVMPLEDVTLDKALQASTARFFGPLFVGKQAARVLAPHGVRASYTLTTGSVSRQPIPNWTVTGAFGSGLHGLMRGLALDMKPVRVSLVSPGCVKTALWDTMDKDVREKMWAEKATGMATGAVAEPEDVAEAFLYLMRDRNCTGTVIDTNGGELLL